MSIKTAVQIRWLIRRDMDEVMSIENRSFDYPWQEEEFLCCLRQRNCIGVVAETDFNVLGYMIYELHKSTLKLLSIAVEPEMVRTGIGSQMIQRLIDKLGQQRRKQITTEVRESNLSVHLFFQACRFRADGVVRQHFSNGEDAYLFRYRVQESEQ